MGPKEIITLVCGLLGILALIYLMFYFSKVISRKNGMGGISGSGRTVQVLERVPLAQDKFLAVIRAGEKILLLGVSPQQVELLTELSEDDLASSGDKGSPPSGKTFLECFKEAAREQPVLRPFIPKDKAPREGRPPDEEEPGERQPE